MPIINKTINFVQGRRLAANSVRPQQLHEQRFEIQSKPDKFVTRFGSGLKRPLIELNSHQLNDLKTVKQAYDPSFDINETRLDETVLHKFLKHPEQNEEVYHFLKEKGIDLKTRGEFGNTAIHSLVWNTGNPNINILKDLIVSGVDVNAVNEQKTTALHRILNDPAVSTETVKAFLDSGFDMKSKSNSGMTVLHKAMKHKEPNLDVVQALLNKKVSAEEKDNLGRSALEFYKQLYPNNISTYKSLESILYPQKVILPKQEAKQKNIFTRVTRQIWQFFRTIFSHLKNMLFKR